MLTELDGVVAASRIEYGAGSLPGSRTKFQNGFAGADSGVLDQIGKQFRTVSRPVCIELIRYGIEHFSEF